MIHQMRKQNQHILETTPRTRHKSELLRLPISKMQITLEATKIELSRKPLNKAV